MSALQPTSFLGELRRAVFVAGIAVLGSAACDKPAPDPKPAALKPSILLITLDTTRADAIGPGAVGVVTPEFNAVAARGRRFQQAYAAVPETLPSHTSMLSGLLPAAHGVHENARIVSDKTPLVAVDLKAAGYRTSAFVSSFVLARRFGLARGFDVFDDELPAGAAERSAAATADRAIADINTQLSIPNHQSLFTWVHFNDPHAPYTPPEPFRAQFAKNPYLGEIAAMDREIGRVVSAFEKSATGPVAIIIAADHGEGLGEHGEREHGHLLYQSTMHVPLVVVGPGVAPGVFDAPVSTRTIHDTLLDFAGLPSQISLRQSSTDSGVVLAEAMKPFLEYGWQPQVMAVAGSHKAILSGRIEGYDLAADPRETRDIASGPALPNSVRNAAYDYPVPVPGAPAETGPAALSAADKQKLASLGYVSGGPAPVIRKDAPRAADMLPTLAMLVQASSLFSAERYADSLPILTKILAADPYNTAAALQLATAHSLLGHRAEADRAFDRAQAMAPASDDVRFYRALHEGRYAMAAGDTPAATAAFERARSIRRDAFQNDLELGVLYLSARRLPEARDALDRVSPASPAYPMAAFKRAQVSVLLREPDAAARIATARSVADAVTRHLIASERLFKER